MGSISPNSDPGAVEVFYGPHKLCPAPLIDFNVDPQFDDSGTRVSNTTRLQLTGSILILPSGSYEQMYTKQEWLRETVFGTDRLDFTILAGANNCTLPSGAIICSGLQPLVKNVNITPDIHVTRFDYSVDLEDSTAASGVSGVTSSLSNQWAFREDPTSCSLQVTHTVNATGPDGEPDKFLQAQRAVKPLLGIANLPLDIPCFTQPNASGAFGITHPANPAGGPIFEYSVQREEVADIANGSYSVTEVFQIVSGVPFFFTAKNESFQEDQNGIVTITIQGTVQGLGRTIDTSFGAEGGQGFSRACSGFVNQVKPALPGEASGVYTKFKEVTHPSGLNVNNPTAYSVTQNRCAGSIDFSITYSDNPANDLPSGIASRTCSVSRTNGIRLFASHPIPFRRLGNLLQDIKTTTPGDISIQCQATAKNTGNREDDLNRAINFVQDELNRLRKIHASSSNFITLNVAGLTEQVDDVGLTSTATINYSFTVDLPSVQDPDADIILRTV